MQDPIADLLTRVRNAQLANHPDVSMPSSKAKIDICKVMEEEGYIEGYSVDREAKPTLSVTLRYHEGSPVIEKISRVSRPGLRVYKACADLPSVRGGLGVAIVSTNKGLLTDRAARAAGVGGEVICTIF
jgi:small subunit ribosomal protein S8